jgi:hypothetical protein
MRVVEHESEGFVWAWSSERLLTPQEVESQFNSFTAEESALFERICANLPSGRDYMETRLQQYGWTAEMFNKAREFQPQPLPSPVPYFERPWWCYENSFQHAEKTGLLYVEGIGISPNGPMVHAWNSTDGTDVLDYTWPQQHLNRYFGIIYDVAWIKENWPIPGGMLGYLHEYTQQGKQLNYRLI